MKKKIEGNNIKMVFVHIRNNIKSYKYADYSIGAN